jgi:hypothetical protein
MNANSALIELDNLTKAVDLISRDQAVQLLNVMNAKLHEILQANIIDILWRSEGQYGDLLMPVAPFNRSHRGQAMGFQVRKDIRSIWTYVYYEGKRVWLEGIKSRDTRQPMRNLAGGETIK